MTLFCIQAYIDSNSFISHPICQDVRINSWQLFFIVNIYFIPCLSCIAFRDFIVKRIISFIHILSYHCTPIWGMHYSDLIIWSLTANIIDSLEIHETISHSRVEFFLCLLREESTVAPLYLRQTDLRQTLDLNAESSAHEIYFKICAMLQEFFSRGENGESHPDCWQRWPLDLIRLDYYPDTSL